MCLNPYIDSFGYVFPCGKCIECKMTRSNEWSYRIMDEASLYKENCFVTLTYNEANLPDGASLKRSDLQAFIKRLRSRLEPKKLRYFYCGEYGSEKGRCHYHIIFFGWKPDDLYFFNFSRKKEPMFRSPLLEDVWSAPVFEDGKQVYLKNGKPKTNPIGFVSVELLENITQARYISLYMQKKPKDGRCAPFVGMSQGIGRDAIDLDKLKIDGNVWHNGKYIRAPRYYRKKAKEQGIDLARGLPCVSGLKQVLIYLKSVYFRARSFFTRFKSLGKVPEDFPKWLCLNSYFQRFIRKPPPFDKNILKKLDK